MISVIFAVANTRYHGLQDQDAYDNAVALAKYILGRIKPAYLVSSTAAPQGDAALLSAEPPALLAGLLTPLPASLTGDARALDELSSIERGVEALSVLAQKVDGSQWALGAK